MSVVRRDWTPLCVALAFAALAGPVIVARIPPLIDFPNHLARMWLLAGGADISPLDAMYARSWSASTNIGTDLLAAFAGTEWVITLARSFVFVAAILPPLGAVMLNRRLFGGASWWHAAFPAFAWSLTMLTGFLNFQIGLGLALAAAALDPGSGGLGRGGLRRDVLRVGLGALLMVVHVFAAGFYAALLSGLAFGLRPAWRSRAAWLCAGRASLASLGMPAALFLTFGAQIPSGLPANVYPRWGGDFVLDKLLVLLSPFHSYDIRADVLFFGLLWLSIRAAARGGWLVHRGLGAVALTLGVIGLVIPSTIDGTPLIDYRFPIMALLTMAAALRPVRTRAPVAALLLLMLGLCRTGAVGAIWMARQADVASVERALRPVPAGAAVLPAFRCCAPGEPAPLGRFVRVNMGTFGHLPALAVIERHAFIPNLFAIPGRHPLRVLPPWSEMAVIEGPPMPVSLLRSDPARLGFAVHYAREWRRRFDFVLVLQADGTDPLDETALPELHLVSDEGFARLYRVEQQ